MVTESASTRGASESEKNTHRFWFHALLYVLETELLENYDIRKLTTLSVNSEFTKTTFCYLKLSL